ncbi:two-component sensor histidine kinase [Cystobacter fuscus]|uniref:histidine kinase n=1 Tax=Cystobacter fuscus TaxID=43 RepID=A0A250J9B9_9BACT|nr:HAMP domain-containing sensor histidine kinase [Cystobacter fuscus]ATB39796.1 two-component sensor histidine kinase [Cystobacter fuscus]
MAGEQIAERVSVLLRRLSRVHGAVVMAVGLVVLTAWVFDLTSLKGLRPGLPTMKANTALCFILSGAALLIAGLTRPPPALRRASVASAVLVVLISSLTLVQYVLDVNLGLDELLVVDPARHVELGYPGRMAPNTTLCFLLLGMALLCLEMETRVVGWPSQYLAALVGVISLVGLAGYLYGQQEFTGIARYTQMAVHTTACFLLLALGVLEARATRGVMRVVSGPGLGGALARWLLPPAFVLPILIVGVVLWAYRSAAFPLPFALALIASGNVMIFTVLVWAAAFALDRAESQRLRGEEERIGLQAREQAARDEATAQQRERTRAENAERDAQRAVREREDILAVVSHDLKNPLSSIGMSTRLLRRLLPEDEAGERMRKHTHTIERSVERMDRLIRDLLDMASLQANQVKLNLESHEVEELVREGLLLLEPLAVEASIELRTRLPPEHCQVRCDRDRFFQVLSNLVGNALKFTPERGTVTVEVVPEASAVRFLVHDTGPGIPAEALPHLFERFWRVEGTGKKGTGLGLSISRGLVKAQGGTMDVRSEQGRGSTFCFTLPRVSAPAPQG